VRDKLDFFGTFARFNAQDIPGAIPGQLGPWNILHQPREKIVFLCDQYA